MTTVPLADDPLDENDMDPDNGGARHRRMVEEIVRLRKEVTELQENGRPGRQVPIDGLGSHQSDKDREDDLRSIRKQAREWRGSHLFDGPDCLLCGVFGPIDEEDPCVVERLGNVLCGIGWDLMASGAVRLKDDDQDYDGFVNLQLGIIGCQMIHDNRVLRHLFTAQKNLFHTMYQLGFGTEADLIPPKGQPADIPATGWWRRS